MADYSRLRGNRQVGELPLSHAGLPMSSHREVLGRRLILEDVIPVRGAGAPVHAPALAVVQGAFELAGDCIELGPRRPGLNPLAAQGVQIATLAPVFSRSHSAHESFWLGEPIDQT